MAAAISSTEHTARLQGFANLQQGDRYYVGLEDGTDFIGFLMLTRGPYMLYIDESGKEHNVGPCDAWIIRRM